jgi:hypothetical protein
MRKYKYPINLLDGSMITRGATIIAMAAIMLIVVTEAMSNQLCPAELVLS